ncbi:MAG: type II toxin-antitoxin system RelE/ParE family toxin [Telluria sp.]
MIEIIQSKTFRKWLAHLGDRQARAIIASRLRPLSLGISGDSSAIGDAISELRIHFGPGYRLYYIRHGTSIVVLLSGEDKSTQRRDIDNAKAIAREWRTNHD